MALLMTGAHAYDFQTNGVYYDVTSSDHVSVTAGDAPYTGFFSISDEVEYQGRTYQVTAIGEGAFRECYSLVGVTLPNGLKTIGDSAFFCCKKLTAIQLPDGLETIGQAAFYGCSNLYGIRIPATVTAIGQEAFLRCQMLSAITVDEQNSHYSAPGGVLMDMQQTRLITFPPQKTDLYDVPEGVTAIADGAFLGCTKLQNVSLPASLRTIGDAAFHGCEGLQSLSVPNSVSSIGVWAFSECSQLAAVRLGSGVAEIGEGAFSFCPQLQDIRVPAANDHYSALDNVLFTKDQRTLVACPGAKSGSYRIPATVETIMEQAFFGCAALESITLPASLSALGDNPFVFCDNLTAIQVSSDHPALTSNDGVLMNKEQTAIVFYPNAKQGAYTVPNGVTALSCGPFMGSRLLTSVTVPNSVERIGNWTFMGCDQLLSVSLPSTLAAIGERAFLDCTSLRTVICSAAPTPTTAFATESLQQATLYVPHGRESSYMETEGWNRFGSISTFGIYADDQNIKRGRWYRLPVCTSGPLHLTALQLDITLPDGLEMATRDDGTCVVELAEGMTGTLTCMPMADGRYRVTMSTDDKRGLNDDATTLMYMSLRSTAEAATGVRDLRLEDISIAFASDVHEGEAQQPDVTMGLNLELFLGDVNQNGRLNVADVTETYRYIRQDATAHFHFSEADVNQNGQVNIADVLGTIDLLHADATAIAREWFWDDAPSADRLQPADMTIEQSGKARLSIALHNSIGNYTAHQFQLLLPAGVTLATDADGRYLCEPSLRYGDPDQTVYIAEIGADADTEGTLYNVVCTSPTVLPISQHEGNLLTLTLAAEDDTALGQTRGMLRRIVFADTDAAEYVFDDVPFGIMIQENTGISLPTVDRLHSGRVYNLSGQRVQTPTKGVYIVDGKKVLMR